MQRPIDNYIVVTGKSGYDLQRKVQVLRHKEDWQPLGAPFVIGSEVSQAMVAYRNAVGFLGFISEAQEAKIASIEEGS